MSKQILATGLVKKHLYVLVADFFSSLSFGSQPCLVFTISSIPNYFPWHERLGHLSLHVLANLPFECTESNKICSSCHCFV